jgi:hypothetical protein
MQGDLRMLLGALETAKACDPVLAMNPLQALSLFGLPQPLRVPVLVSNNVPAGIGGMQRSDVIVALDLRAADHRGEAARQHQPASALVAGTAAVRSIRSGSRG